MKKRKKDKNEGEHGAGSDSDRDLDTSLADFFSPRASKSKSPGLSPLPTFSSPLPMQKDKSPSPKLKDLYVSGPDLPVAPLFLSHSKDQHKKAKKKSEEDVRDDFRNEISSSKQAFTKAFGEADLSGVDCSFFAKKVPLKTSCVAKVESWDMWNIKSVHRFDCDETSAGFSEFPSTVCGIGIAPSPDYEDIYQTELRQSEDKTECFQAMDFILRRKIRDCKETEEFYEAKKKQQEETPDNVMLWSERFRPRSGGTICGNRKVFNAVSLFLKTWSERSCFDDNLSCGGSDFYPLFHFKSDSEDSNSHMDQKIPRNLLVLEGKGSCCKTSGVLACAEERGLDVMELNASECRSAKSVADKTGETTGCNDLSQTTIGDLVPPEKRTRADGRRRRGRLFLFEDVDVFFSDDVGLHNAISSLAASTTFPIIATCRSLPPEVQKLSQFGELIKLPQPSSTEVAYHAMMILLLEAKLFSANSSSQVVRGDVLTCSVLALAQLLSRDMGLRGLVSSLQFWSRAFLWKNLSPSSFLYAHLGLLHDRDMTSSPCSYFDNNNAIERDLQTAHGSASDIGFSSWLYFVTACSTNPDIGSIADAYSLLDVVSNIEGSPWSSPLQSLPQWHRMNNCSCSFEAAFLKQCIPPNSVSLPWHIPRSIPPQSSLSCSATSLPSHSHHLPPHSFHCLSGAAKHPSPWHCLAPSISEWYSVVLPALRQIALAEDPAYRSPDHRRFVCHLSFLSHYEISALIEDSMFAKTRKSFWPCECYACQVKKYIRDTP